MSEFKIGDRVLTTGGWERGARGTIDAIDETTGNYKVNGQGQDLWYTQGQLTLITPTYKPGDVVRLAKDFATIEGAVSDYGQNVDLGFSSIRIQPRLEDGWTLKVIKEAPEPLPTEPGHYVNQNDAVYTLTARGQWLSGPYRFDPTGQKLTRLVPEGSETPGTVWVALDKYGVPASVHATNQGARDASGSTGFIHPFEVKP